MKFKKMLKYLLGFKSITQVITVSAKKKVMKFIAVKLYCFLKCLILKKILQETSIVLIKENIWKLPVQYISNDVCTLIY